MKKVLAAFLSLALLSGCSSGGSGSASSGNKPLEIKSSELGNYITYYEVTPENWEEYFDHEQIRKYQVDSFGETTENYSEVIEIVPKEGYVLNDDLVMRFHHSRIETFTWNNGDTSTADYEEDRDFTAKDFIFGSASISLTMGGPDWGGSNPEVTITDFALTKSVGSVFTINIPEEAWQTNEENGEEFFVLDHNGSKKRLYRNGTVEVLNGGKVVQTNVLSDYCGMEIDNPTFDLIARSVWGIPRMLEDNQ